jgi:MFS family permease
MNMLPLKADVLATPANSPHDPRYEAQAVILLSLGFGLVGFDRMMILPLFPTLMRELSLTYADIGLITGALGVSWALCALMAGHISDLFGARRTLIVAMTAFSLLVGVTGFATGLLMLVAMRTLMGAAEGAFVPPSIAATSDAARPSRRGLVLGLQQMASPLFGLTLAPLVVTQLLGVMPWRTIFLLLALPGLVLAVLLGRTIRDRPRKEVKGLDALPLRKAVRQVVRQPNIGLLMVLMLCLLSVFIVLSALLPSYLTDSLQLPVTTTGGVLAAMGLGSVSGSICVSALSDRIGRRKALALSAAGMACSIGATSIAGAEPALLFCGLFAVTFFNFGMLTLVVAVIPGESAAPHLRSIATGVIIFAGEMIGGGVAPFLAGLLADSYGLHSIFGLPAMIGPVA